MGPKTITQTIFICITTSRWRTCCQGVYICTHFNDTVILQSISVYQFDQAFFNAASETSKLIPDSAIIFQTIDPRYLMPVLLSQKVYVNDGQIWYCRSDIHCFFLNKVLKDCGTL